MAKHHLFYNDNHDWFFLIPEDAELPEGDYTIQTIFGQKKQVNPDVLEQYIVPQELAEAHLSQRVREGLDGIQNSMMGFLSKIYDNKKPEGETGWNVDFLADLFDQSPEAVRHDPQATKDGLTDLFAEGALFFENVKSDDENRQNMAKEQIAGFLNLLKAHDIQVAAEAYAIADILTETYQSMQAEAETEKPN